LGFIKETIRALAAKMLFALDLALSKRTIRDKKSS